MATSWNYLPTGAVRDGEAVTKSKLILDDDKAPQIAAYLKGRAKDMTGTFLAEKLGISIPRTSLNGVEWNALTYAGHTVWNVHNEKGEDGYKGGVKRRPRTEWIIQRDTHPTLITDDEAEAILQKLDAGRIKTYRTRAKHLLTGILTNQEGQLLHGDGEYYRHDKKSVKASRVDGAILQQITSDLQSEAFIKAIVKSAQQSAKKSNDSSDLKTATEEICAIDKKIENLTNLLTETTATATLLRKIESLEQERSGIQERVDSAELATQKVRAIQNIQESDVKAILNNIAVSIDEQDRDDIKEILRGLIDRIVFDDSTLDCCIYYKIPVKSRNLVASPTRFELVLPP